MTADGYSRIPHWLGDLVDPDCLALDYWLNRAADGRTHLTYVSEAWLRERVHWGRARTVRSVGRLVAAGRLKRLPRPGRSTLTYICQTPREPAPWETTPTRERAAEEEDPRSRARGTPTRERARSRTRRSKTR